MGTDNIFHKKKARRAESHSRERAKRDPYSRVLIVCEGQKTEPNYFKNIRTAYRLNSNNVVIADKKYGLDPKSLVEYALDEYKKDNDFNKIFCVFDRDKHATYHDALNIIRDHHLKKGTELYGIISVPCFEIWLLLHFINTTRPFCTTSDDSDCELVISELKKFIPNYKKGMNDNFICDERLDAAINNAKKLEKYHLTSNTDNPSTNIYLLIEHLKSLKR